MQNCRVQNLEGRERLAIFRGRPPESGPIPVTRLRRRPHRVLHSIRPKLTVKRDQRRRPGKISYSSEEQIWPARGGRRFGTRTDEQQPK